ncbi:hypothetical protein KEM52_004701 [Ascosphaera acerosa]|nr:hypothetical protein KEM52_004701 [Ascosphaera acerosa]
MADVDARLQQLTDNVLPTAPFLTSSSYLDRDSEPAKARHTASAASAATTTRAARPPPSQQQCQRQGQQPVFLHSGRTAARVFARGEEQLQYLTFLSYQDWDTSLVAVGGWSDAAGNLVVEEEEEEEEHGLFRKGQEARAARTPLGAPVAAPSTVRKAAATPSLPSEKAAAPTSAIATVTAPAPPPPLPTTGQDPPKARKKMSWNAYREIKTTGAREGRTDATSTATTATPAAPATAPAAAVQGVKREPPVTRPTRAPFEDFKWVTA